MVDAMQLVPVVLLAALVSVASSSSGLAVVTCGSVIKLMNNNYKARLHSHDVKYGSGSGQQSVTAVDEETDGNSYWSIKGATDKPCKRGEPLKCGTTLRLEHMSTGKNLHSHLFSSPLSGHQEISAFGKEGDGDTGDNWQLHCSDDYWERSESVRFKHVDTEKWLSLSGRTYGRPISGQMEVIGNGYSDSSAYWMAKEGVYVTSADGKEDGGGSGGTHDEL